MIIDTNFLRGRLSIRDTKLYREGTQDQFIAVARCANQERQSEKDLKAVELVEKLAKELLACTDDAGYRMRRLAGGQKVIVREKKRI